MAKLKRILLLAGVTVVLLEATLQVLALATWLWFSRADPAPRRAGEQVVLCVGDSFTYGLGASSRETSYPGVLDRILRERLGSAWRAVNQGQPGQNSRDVLRRLPAQLDEYQPRAVVLIVGINDHWSRPEELVLDEGAEPVASGFRWELRTLRLLRTFRGLFAGGGAAPDRGGGGVDGPEALDALGRGRALLEAGDFPAAEQVLLEVLEAADADLRPTVRLDLAILYARWGNAAKAAAQVTLLREAYAARPGEALGETLVLALVASGRDDEALALERELIRVYPGNSRIRAHYADHLFRAGDVPAALEQVERAAELAAGSGDVRHRAYVWRRRAEMYADIDPWETLRSIVRAHLADPEMAFASGLIRLNAPGFTDEMLSRALDEAQAPPAARAELEGFWRSAGEDTYPEQIRVMRSHLRQILALCRARGARLVMASYPTIDPQREREHLAAELGVPFVPVHEAFAVHLAGDPEADLFMPDGHCNDRGYRLMAERIAAFLVPLLGG